MHIAIAQGLPYMHQVHLDLLLGPMEALLEKLQTKRLQPVEQIRLAEATQHLELGVLGPGVDGQLEDLLVDVDEASLLVPALELVCDAQGFAQVHGGAVLGLGPLCEGVVRGHGAVVAVDGGHVLLGLHPAAGLEMAVGLCDDLAEVLEAAEHDAGVDVVHGVEHPVVLVGVVDDELDVVGDPGRFIRWIWVMSGERKRTILAGWGRDLFP